MKFSIIIPCYKVEKYLSECVDSVLCQTYRDLEIILVDDGSPDLCPKICDEYAKKDLRVKVIHQKNAGIACARNAGIAIATGDYVICIDSDDYLIDNNVLCRIEEKTRGNADVVMFGYKKYFESDGSWGPDICAIIDDDLSVSDIIETMLLNGSYMATAWTKAVKREILISNGIIFRPGMVSGEDVDWFLNVLCYTNRIECLPKVCLVYRQRPGSISHNPKVQSLTDFIWILENWPKRIAEREIDAGLKNALMSTMAYYLANTMVLYNAYSRRISKPFKERLKKQMYLFQYAISPRALTVRSFYTVLGFCITEYLLKFWAKLKKRQ